MKNNLPAFAAVMKLIVWILFLTSLFHALPILASTVSGLLMTEKKYERMILVIRLLQIQVMLYGQITGSVFRWQE